MSRAIDAHSVIALLYVSSDSATGEFYFKKKKNLLKKEANRANQVLRWGRFAPRSRDLMSYQTKKQRKLGILKVDLWKKIKNLKGKSPAESPFL